MDEKSLFIVFEINQCTGEIEAIRSSAQTDEEFNISEKALSHIWQACGRELIRRYSELASRHIQSLSENIVHGESYIYDLQAQSKI